jgi:hypothetical protein
MEAIKTNTGNIWVKSESSIYIYDEQRSGPIRKSGGFLLKFDNMKQKKYGFYFEFSGMLNNSNVFAAYN